MLPAFLSISLFSLTFSGLGFWVLVWSIAGNIMISISFTVLSPQPWQGWHLGRPILLCGGAVLYTIGYATTSCPLHTRCWRQPTSSNNPNVSKQLSNVLWGGKLPRVADHCANPFFIILVEESVSQMLLITCFFLFIKRKQAHNFGGRPLCTAVISPMGCVQDDLLWLRKKILKLSVIFIFNLLISNFYIWYSCVCIVKHIISGGYKLVL